MTLDLARDHAVLGEERVGVFRQEEARQLVEVQREPGHGLVQAEGCTVKAVTCHSCGNFRLSGVSLIETD